MKENDAFPVSHLKWEDLAERPARLTIAAVVMGEVGQGDDKETKPIMSFANTEKTFVINKTNFNTIANCTGQPDPDHWAGNHITLFKDVTEFRGKVVNCIRVQLSNNGAPAVQAALPPETQEEDPGRQAPPPPLTDDDIPF